MFFELNNTTYHIKFYRTGVTTVAELFEVNSGYTDADSSDMPAMTSLGVYGIARPHYTDRFEKKIGRRVALTHLLENLTERYEDDGFGGEVVFKSEGPITLTKEDRELIWAKYFETHRK